MAQLKEQNKTPEKELNKSEMAKLSDAEFKTLVIRMLWELSVCGQNIKEEMKVTVSEINKNPQGTNSERKQGLKSMIWDIGRNKYSTRTERQNKNLKKWG